MNQHQIRQQQQTEARLRFIRALSAGQVHVYDRFGQPIEAGAQLLFHSPVDIMCQVVSVQPDLTGNVPLGMMTVTMQVMLPVSVPANQPWQHAILLHMDGPKPQATPAAEPGDDLAGAGEDTPPAGEEMPRSGPTGLVDTSGRPMNGSTDEPVI